MTRERWKYRRFGTLLIVIALSGCGAPPVVHQVTSPPSMSPSDAQDQLRRLLLTGRAMLISRENRNGSIVRDVRLRRDGIGFLSQPALYGMGYGPDIDSNLREVGICYYSGVEENPRIWHYNSPLSDYTSYPYQVVLCSYQMGFPTYEETLRFANALYVLKHNAR